MVQVSEDDLRRLEDQLDADELRGLWIVFHDYNARACAKWIPRPSALQALLRGGVFARANLNFTIDDQQVPNPRFGADSGDFFALPDPTTLTAIPYRPGVGRVLSYLMTEAGELWEGCPRGRLLAAVKRLDELGLSARVAFEPEFTLYREDDDGQPHPVDNDAMYSVDRIDGQFNLLSRIEQALNEQSVRVIQIGSEYGAGQLELNLHHETPLKAADDVLILKETVKALARDAGLQAIFMPKPSIDAAGNGLHVHISLWVHDGDISSGSEEFGISRHLRHAIGGIMRHGPALCAVAAPTVNSYKRLQPASWAPAHLAYGAENRAALVRIPGPSRSRIEFRAGDHTANPYLLLSALLSAMADGLELQFDPGPAATGDLGHLTAEELAEQGISMLPRSLEDAFVALEADQLIMDALGPVCGPELIRIKRYELERYRRHVSEWERSVYFERV